jgi:hypothetical protein
MQSRDSDVVHGFGAIAYRPRGDEPSLWADTNASIRWLYHCLVYSQGIAYAIGWVSWLPYY